MIIVLGLPRSGTTLVYNKLYDLGYSAPKLSDLGLQIPRHLEDFHRNHHGLAELHDLPCLEDAKKYQLVKSVNLVDLPLYLEAFSEASYLVTVRPAGELMASVGDYFLASGLRWPYNPEDATRQLVRIASTFPEKFSFIDVVSLPEWFSGRIPTKTFTSLNLDHLFDKLRGTIKRVSIEDFRRQDLPARKKAKRLKDGENNSSG